MPSRATSIGSCTCTFPRRGPRPRRTDRAPLGALGELAPPAPDGAPCGRLAGSRQRHAAHAHGLRGRVHARLPVLHERTGRDRALSKDDNLGGRGGTAPATAMIFVVAAYAIVWGALLVYLVSLRARGA